MPQIFDNIENHLIEGLNYTLDVSHRADFCVGYFNLRGWKQVAHHIDNWNGGDENCCRLLVGMQKPPIEIIKEYFSKAEQGGIDNQSAVTIRKKLAQEFKEQLTIGFPTDADEQGLRKLSAQIKAKKVVVKLFLRYPLHAKLYLCFREDKINPTIGYVGSSNLTLSGLSLQGEFNVDVLDRDASNKLSKWFNDRWDDKFCMDISDELAEIIDNSWAADKLIHPYHIYLKIAYHLAREARAGLSEFKVSLNLMLGHEFSNLGIKYEQVTWDEKKNKEGKSIKRSIKVNDIESLEPFHWGYEFSEIFRKKDGFDAIITNPPWEVFKPNSKEFFLDYSKTVSRKKMSIKDFEKEQEVVLKDKEIREAWTEYLSKYPHVSSYYRSSKQYKNQISIVNGKKAGSDINLYKLFTEQCFNLLKKNGYCGIVIPSGIYTDLGTKQLREMLFEQNKMTGLFCFENRKEIFEGVDSRFKFVVLSFEKGGVTKSFPAAFMRHDVNELDNFPQYGSSIIRVDFIKKQSPDSLSVMEIKNELEFLIADKLFKFPMLNMEIEDTWNIKLGNEFHMTNDSHLFKTSADKNTLPLYEGKMIWQFNSYYAEPKYWINSSVGRKAILGRNADDGSLLDYQKYRIAFREIASSTNERGLIATILPKNVFANHKLMLSTSKSIGLDSTSKIVLASFLNSFVFDFQVRQRTTTSISMHIFYQLPVPRLKPKDKWYKPIVERAARLICTTAEFAELWEEVIKNKWSEKAAATQEYERNKLRAELDGIIAHIYGLTEEEFTYILSTFPIVSQPQKVAAQNAYRDVERGLIK